MSRALAASAPRRALAASAARRALADRSAPALALGSLRLGSAVMLSPLERVSDVGFRRVCHEQGAALTWTEMVYASDLVRPRGGRTGADLIDTHDAATPTGVQLLVDRTTARDGWGVDLLRRALEALEEGAATGRPEWANLVAVDLNFGCPAPSLSRRGAGPAQLRRRSKVRALFEALAAWRRSTSLGIGAVGAKIRLGNNASEMAHKVHVPVAEAAADALDYLVVHARHGGQRSADAPTWEAIGEAKAAAAGSPLAVIANGDVRTPDDVRRVRRLTGCDGVMVGRAAMRNPWCLRAIAAAAGGAADGAAAGAAGGEWPSVGEVERAAALNAEWSAGRPAAARYARFREENYARLRQAAAAALPAADWYGEWSAGSARRRQLARADDAGVWPS